MQKTNLVGLMNFERLLVRAATIDELLSEDFETLPGQKGDTDLATQRLAAWCRSCTSGDWTLFSRRLERDQLSFALVLARFATVRRRATSSTPQWLADARWIDAAFHNPIMEASASETQGEAEPYAFEQLYLPVVDEAEQRLWPGLSEHVAANLSGAARACLRCTLLGQLSELCAPVLYELFDAARKADGIHAESPNPQQGATASCYERFIAAMREAGLRRLFDEKPVLLRLIATLTRQWIDTTGEFLVRLDADLQMIRRDILCCVAESCVANIQAGLSDPHNSGRSVQIVAFENGSRVVYKPKDVRLDANWHSLIERLNRADPPIDLKAVRTVPRDGYGWTEFIAHTKCAERQGFQRFFQRAGAWLALFHAFVGTDMHEENMIAAGDQPVPIDLEMILQASAPEHQSDTPETHAFDLAATKVAESVTMTGLLPAYARSPENTVYELGGLNNQQRANMALRWENVNSDQMRWSRTERTDDKLPNMPRIGAEYARLGDHIDDVVAGFEAYASFLLRQRSAIGKSGLFDGFAGLAVRKVVKPTRFYYMLLQRLKDHRSMVDGAAWSAQADFIARLTDWDKDTDPMWSLQRAERAALLEMNVPHFVSPSDADEIAGASGISVHTLATPGIDRARARIERLDEQEIAWQSEVIRQSTNTVSSGAGRAGAGPGAPELLGSDAPPTPASDVFLAEAEKIVAVLSDLAIRSGPGAAWIGLDGLGDSKVCQLVPLGQDLYNGASGIAVFLAAYARLTGRKAAGSLALAGLAGLRQNLRTASAARMARSLGIGGAAGLGSIVYALTLLAKFMDNEALLRDAHVAAQLFSDDLIAADKSLDIIGGSAGAILGLLGLYRATKANDVLERATRCGEHLLGQHRVGSQGNRSWCGQGSGLRALNGMSHGAAGFAYSLASLSAATGREIFATAALECIAFENASYDAVRGNWPDCRDGAEVFWSCQWCQGATGIGLARAATLSRGSLDATALRADVERALKGAEHEWPGTEDTLCCGTLGGIEFLCEASSALGRTDLRDLASRRLMALVQTAASNGDYRWSAGSKRYNLGLFRGLAGVGYTLLRRVDASLPNVIIWE